MHNPNRPVKGANLREEERHTDTAPSGDAGRDGYTRLARRPRSRHHNQMVDDDRADRIEGYSMPDYPYID